MATHKLFTSRIQIPANTFIGEKGRMFYDETSGNLRISDGQTAGGQPVSLNVNIVTSESIVPETDNLYGIGSPELRWNHLHIGDGGIYFDGNQTTNAQTTPYIPGAVTEDIIPLPTDNSLHLGNATHRWGDVWIGKASLHLLDETLNTDVALTVNNGTMYLNGIQSLAVGSLTIVGNTLTSVTNNLDINIGDANDTGFFYVRRKAQFNNTSFGSTQPMVSFNASGGTEPATIFPDTILQTVSRPDKNSRIIQRAYGSTGTVGGDNSYAVWGSYAARGTITAPAALKQNDILMRVSGNGYGVSTWGSGGARMEYVAIENFTDSAKGTKINFWTTPAGQLASQNVASINSVGIVAAGVEFSATGRIQTDAGIPITAKAISSATYVATLGIDGKLDTSQIPSSLTGAIVFKGGWDATANSPSLANGSGTDGYEYAITTAGTRSLGTQTGSVSYQAGGYIIYGSGIWNYTPPVSNFTYAIATAGTHIKVNGNQGTQETGVITLTTDATPNSTTATIVSRDASGNFSANMITANLTGVVTGSVSGNAGSVTNGVYTTGSQSIDGTKTFTSAINGTITTATYATSFNTATLVATAVTAQNVSGGIGVATITAGTGTAVSASTGAVTVWNTTPAFNTSTLVATAVQAGTVTTAAQPAITSVGTLTSLTVSGSITDSIGNVRSIAIRNTATSYVLTAADNGQMVSITTGSVTINSGIFASPFGQTISIYNNSTTSMSILAGAGVTLRLAGTLSTGTRTLARYGVATTICVSSNTFVMSGAGLS